MRAHTKIFMNPHIKHVHACRCTQRAPVNRRQWRQRSQSSLERGNPDTDFMLHALALCLDDIPRNTFQTWPNMGPTFKLTTQKTNTCDTISAPVFHTCRQHYCTDVWPCTQFFSVCLSLLHEVTRGLLDPAWICEHCPKLDKHSSHTRQPSGKHIRLQLLLLCMWALMDWWGPAFCTLCFCSSMYAVFVPFSCVSSQMRLNHLAIPCTTHSQGVTLTFALIL